MIKEVLVKKDNVLVTKMVEGNVNKYRYMPGHEKTRSMYMMMMICEKQRSACPICTV